MNRPLLIKVLEDKATDNESDISWRFEEKNDILKKILTVDKEGEELINDYLESNNFIKNFELNKNRFDIFEEIEFENNYNLITFRLEELFTTNSQVVLFWLQDSCTILTDLQTFIVNWEDFYYPSSDDLIVINQIDNWVMYFTHYELYQFGRILKSN
jgi:hypothetical protein